MINYKTILIIFLLNITFFSTAAQTIVDYDNLKAAYIERFTRFITWPNDDSEIGETIDIGVFKDAEFTEILKKIYTNQKIKNKKVKVAYISTIESAKNKDIVFIGKIDDTELFGLTSALKNLPVLTIANTEGYSDKDVIINLYPEGGNLKFEINTTASESAGLIISYRLLQKARLIKGNKSE